MDSGLSPSGCPGMTGQGSPVLDPKLRYGWRRNAAAEEPREGATMDHQSGQESDRKSGHLMLITPERVFYAGLLGRPRERCSGAFHIYVAIEGGLRLVAG